MAGVDNARNDLFETSDGPGSSAGAVLRVIIAAVLVFGGFYLMGISFELEEGLGFWMFSAALLAEGVGFWTAFRGDSTRERSAN